MNDSTKVIVFKPRARMLLLLGDQLIKDPGIAVFELVKNAFDADSPDVTVTMSHITDQKLGTIVVEDSGTGMDYKTVTEVWMEPGTDYRARQRARGERTPKYHRLPLGEKGVGRFAVHKLGNEIRLITRKLNAPEVVVEIDWTEYSQQKYLDQIPVRVFERTPKVFLGESTGTKIEISDLRNDWSRGMVRDLARAINSICSPFENIKNKKEKKTTKKDNHEFTAKLVLTENQDWLEGILNTEKVLEYALFKASCEITGTTLKYDYEFRPYPAMDAIKARIVKQNIMQLSQNKKENIDIDVIEKQIGPIHLDFYIYDREAKILSLGVADKQGLKEFLDKNGGVRVYREGIRVYDYGEPGNDWLDLGAKRVNIPTKNISNNLVIGAVSLHYDKNIIFNPDKNLGLIEKTNREGFVDNAAFRALQWAVVSAFTQITQERNKDKLRIRNAYNSSKIKEPVIEDLTDLKSLIEKKGLEDELGPYIDRIAADFIAIKERFLTSASTGLSLSTVIHEVEKGVQELSRAVEEDRATPRIKRLARHLAELIEGFASLIRRSGMTREQAKIMIDQARFNTELRLKVHGITLVTNFDQGDFEVKCSRRLTIATLMNLIDNSIWWLENKWGESKKKKRIYIGTSKEFSDGPAIVIADNGPGFMDPPEYMVEPFMSRKPDGMGLGLHIADQVMRGQKGRLAFPDKGDVSLPTEFDGAVVALVFGGNNR